MDNITGLSSKEVQDRIDKGLTNKKTNLPTKTTWQIIRSNLFNIFNGVNFLLAIIVIIAGSPKNALFSLVIITNSMVGIFQELKAKKTLENLSLLNRIFVSVIRDGKPIIVSSEDIVIDDMIIVQSGDQIVADGILITNEGIEVDESSLTGEADPISKNTNDQILSGSHVVSGYGYLKVTHIGNDTYIAKLSNEAKKFKIINSELKLAVKKIVKIIFILIVPIGSVLLYSQLFVNQKSFSEAIVGVVAGIIGMLPQGLVLLTTATFLVSIIKLSKWNTLIQELPATEMLARVDTICLDKTGTLTEGTLSVIDLISTTEDLTYEEIKNKLSAVVYAFDSENPTKKAILDKYPSNPNWNISEKIPFSSARKWSAIRLDNDEVIILGAPELVLRDNYKNYSNMIEEKAKEGKRILVLCSSFSSSIESSLNEVTNPIAFIILEDSLRPNVTKTIKFFNKQGIDLKIISGDNPITVSAIAKSAGVIGAENYIYGPELSNDYGDLKDILEKYTVFGRVSPEQKKNLIVALKSMGKTVAMTGDGVNDILALKESDCGIVMASGNTSTKSVAQVVLLDSDFSNLPKIIGEGRKIINNLERVASLYLTKTIYSVLLSIIFSAYLMPYPFIPIQLTLMGALLIGIPSFFLAFTANTDKVKGNFLSRLLSKTIPKGITVAVFTSIIFFVATEAGLSLKETRTLAILTAGGIGLVILIRIAKPLNLLKAILILFMFLAFALAFLSPIGKHIFSFTDLQLKYILISFGLIAVSSFFIDICIFFFRKISIFASHVKKSIIKNKRGN